MGTHKQSRNAAVATVIMLVLAACAPPPGSVSLAPTVAATLHLPTPTQSPTAVPSATATETPAPISTLPPPVATPSPISILAFTVDPLEVLPGDQVTLTWNAMGEWASVYSVDDLGRLSEPSFTVPLSGTLVVTTSATLRDRADYVLYAGVGDDYEQASLSVALRCPDVWFLPDPPEACPLPPHFTTVVAQHFQRGLLLWFEASVSDERRPVNEIVVLFDDDQHSPRWAILVDDWAPGMPEEDPDIVAPPELYEPVRGFGHAWRERPGLRDRLGWAIEEEFVVGDGAFQCASGKYGTCYVTGPDGIIFALEPNGSEWTVWLGP